MWSQEEVQCKYGRRGETDMRSINESGDGIDLLSSDSCVRHQDGGGTSTTHTRRACEGHAFTVYPGVIRWDFNGKKGGLIGTDVIGCIFRLEDLITGCDGC